MGLTDTAKKLLGTCVEKFALETEDINEYQLWVRSSKEAGMYPLIGKSKHVLYAEGPEFEPLTGAP